MYKNVDIPFPHTFNDDYSNRSDAASHAKMRIEENLWHVDIKTKSPLRKQVLYNLKSPEDLSNYELHPKEGGAVKFTTYQERKNWIYQRYIKDYLRCIASIDDNIGRMLKFLDENGLAENTIVIYTSDQGFFLGDHGWFDKRFMYEESLRMPFVMRYPKEISPNSTNDDIITNLDFAELFLDYANISVPEDMQGKSFRENLKGNTPNDWREGFYYRYWMNGADHAVYSHYGIRTKQYKLIYYYCDPLGQKGAIKDPHEPMWELFNLEKDPFELNNVYEDPNYFQIREKLRLELDKLQKEAKDNPYIKK
jgi:arylsulfatase A-like enzyme